MAPKLDSWRERARLDTIRAAVCAVVGYIDRWNFSRKPEPDPAADSGEELCGFFQTLLPLRGAQGFNPRPPCIEDLPR